MDTSPSHAWDEEENDGGRPPLNASRVPSRKFFGESMSCLVHYLHIAHIDESETRAETLLGYQVPHFQRGNNRWTRDQQVAFIESMYMGANIGSFMVNLPAVSLHANDDRLNNALLDGLQRLTALKAYFNSEIAVKGDDGKERMWSQLGADERRHLLRITYPWVLTRYTSMDLMKEAYERHNFGGTAHTPADEVAFRSSKPQL